ncbi:MAG: hypothetical protein M1837_002411 [Sclerophora amabilis]|nr:MAG: hypothetical protein M1837_002411 [Sclerophora amabilis]
MPPDPVVRQGGLAGLFKHARYAARGNHLLSENMQVAEKHLEQCLKSLESRPQSWTSYSNGRQNAFVMCQAARSIIDREVESEVSSKLIESLHDASVHLKNHKAFAAAVQKFQKQLLKDLESTDSTLQNLLASLVQEIDSGLREVIGKAVSAVTGAEERLSNLNQDLGDSSSDVNKLRDVVSQVFVELSQGSSGLALRQEQDWRSSHELATKVQDGLESIRSRELDNFMEAFGSIRHDLHASHEMLALMHLRQNTIDQRLVGLDKAFEGMKNKADYIQSAQDSQAQTQYDLHEALKREMQLAREVITRVSEDAFSLQSAMGDVVSQVQDLHILRSIGAILGRWTWILLALIGICLAGKRVRQYLAIGLGELRLIDVLVVFSDNIKASPP